MSDPINPRYEASVEIQTRSPPEVSVSEHLRVLGHVGIRRVAVLQVQNRKVPMCMAGLFVGTELIGVWMGDK